MIALYSFKKLEHFKPFNKLFLDIAYTSVELAKKHMKTKLVCDEEAKSYFDNANITFDEYEFNSQITSYKGDRYCMPKIYAMMAQKEPYIHLDFDTFIFNKPSSSLPVAFANPEVPIGSLPTFKLISYVYETYVKSYKEHFYPLITKDMDHTIKWDIFPSNNILLVNEPILIKDVWNEILDEFIPESILEKMNPSFIEQLSLVHMLRKYKIDFEFLAQEPTFDIFHYGEVDDKVKDMLHRGRDFIHITRYDWYPKAIQYLVDYVWKKYKFKRKNTLV